MSAARILSCCALLAMAGCNGPGTGAERATLGLTTAVPSDEVAAALELADNVRIHGRAVEAVEAGGPAAQAGIRTGDVLLQLGPNDLYSADDVVDVLSVSAPGDSVSVLFKRPGEGEALRSRVVLGAERARAAPGIRWQFAGLGQLPAALDAARAQEKRLLVGLSGAET